jgi:hypothetical protein
VTLGAKYGSDEFFVVPWLKLRGIVIHGHRDWLASHGGRRPRTPDSLHTAVEVDQLAPYRSNWDLVSQLIGHAA